MPQTPRHPVPQGETEVPYRKIQTEHLFRSPRRSRWRWLRLRYREESRIEGDGYVESVKIFVDRISPRWTSNGNPLRHTRRSDRTSRSRRSQQFRNALSTLLRRTAQLY